MENWTLMNEIIEREEFCEAIESIEALVCCADDIFGEDDASQRITKSIEGNMLVETGEVILNCIAPFIRLLEHGVGIRDNEDRRAGMITNFILGEKDERNPEDVDEYSDLYDVLTKPMH